MEKSGTNKKGTKEPTRTETEEAKNAASTSLTSSLSANVPASESSKPTVFGEDLNGAAFVANTDKTGSSGRKENTEITAARRSRVKRVRESDAFPPSPKAAKLQTTAADFKFIPTLPPEIWAQILDFCVYDDVARMARVSTVFLQETMLLLKSLYFVNDGAFNLEASQATRFQSGRLEEIYIDSTFDIAPDPDDESQTRSLFSYVESSQPAAFIDFVAALLSIKNVFFGAGKREPKADIIKRLQLEKEPATCNYVLCLREKRDKFWMNAREASTMNVHEDLFLSLVQSYRAGQLSQEVSLYGLPTLDASTSFLLRKELFYGIIETFPLAQVRVSLLSHFMEENGYFPPSVALNVKLDVAIRKVLERRGGREVLASTNSRDLLFLIKYFRIGDIPGSYGIDYSAEHIEALRLLVTECGLDPTVIDSEEILEVYSQSSPLAEEGLPYKIHESNFRALAALGFAVNTGSFRLVPDENFTGVCSI